MYAIYANIYGIEIPSELNKRLQNAELTELLDTMQLPEGFTCDVPYAGDGYADIHLGVELSSTDGDKRPVTIPTDEQIKICKEGIEAVKKQFAEGWQEWKDEFPENGFSADDDDQANQFLAELGGELVTYTAYSTS